MVYRRLWQIVLYFEKISRMSCCDFSDEFSELKKETNILKKRISDLEDECANLIDCDFFIMKLKKERENNREEIELLHQRISMIQRDEIEKLHQRISMLEDENKQLKENFKKNVVDIIKQYVYSLFFRK
jgi:cell division protein FtsB